MSDYGLDWVDFSGDSATPEVALLLSVRSQSLLLAAIKQIQERHMWFEPTDTEFDDIDEAIAECITEILTEVEIVVDATPVGSIVAFIGLLADIPPKWLPCNFTLYAQADYPELAALLSATWISGDNFRTPNLQGHYIRGLADDTGASGESGSNSHTLTIGELPSHHHVVPAHAHTVGTRPAAGSNTGSVSLGSLAANGTISTDTEPATDTSDVGDGTAFSVEPLHLRFYYIIKALP